MENNNIRKRIESMRSTVNRETLFGYPLSKWAPMLAEECSVYRLGDQYIAKPFDSIPYRFCSRDKAQEILEDNLDALLSFKYFPAATDDEVEKIKDIKKYCVNRIASTLIKAKFDDDSSHAKMMKPIPSSCVAFNNGVYDFAKDDWLFRYDEIPIDDSKSIILYSNDYRIMWYINRDFVPQRMDFDREGNPVLLDRKDGEEHLSPLELSFGQWMGLMREADARKRNMFFELLWNMSYDQDGKQSDRRALHLAEIFGFLLYPGFVQNFVFFVGDGSNGKDSVFDAFFRQLIRPIPAGNQVSSLESDKFIMGSLTGVSHNISSETESEAIRRSAVLKQLTGSPFQTIEEKGVDKYTGYMNCKFVFSANNKEQLKFGDASVGFRRRINMYECYYQWDRQKKFMKKFPGTYDTTYGDSSDLRADKGMEAFFYTAMFGVKEATENFTKPFCFTENEYDASEYTEINVPLKLRIEKLTIEDFRTYVRMHREEADSVFYTEEKVKLSRDQRLGKDDIAGADGLGFVDYFGNGGDFASTLEKSLKYDRDANPDDGTYPVNKFFTDNELYVSTNVLSDLAGDGISKTKMTQELKRIWPGSIRARLGANSLYVLVSFETNGKMTIVNG